MTVGRSSSKAIDVLTRSDFQVFFEFGAFILDGVGRDLRSDLADGEVGHI